jgi:tripartite-type tricarboxylate transporter receptor subunit TctC
MNGITHRVSGLASALLALLLNGALAEISPAFAADAVSFRDKTVTMIIGSETGGGTDASGRVVAPFLAKYLPGSPSIVVRNMPGADGMTALNYLISQTRADGLTATAGSSTQVDPLMYRKANAHFDPSKFAFVGGVGRGGTVLIINRDAEKRLYDKSAEPVIMGSNALPRSGMQVTLWGIEYLGWNAKWVVGYRGTGDVILALERGEIDMTSTGTMFQIRKFEETGAFKVLNQSGALEGGVLKPRPDFGDAPLFTDQMKGKIADPLAEKAFTYWQSINAMDKWLGLVPGTPKEVVAAYREAFAMAAKDSELLAQGRKISEDFASMSADDVTFLVNRLASTPMEVTEYAKLLMRKQGLRVE